MVLLGVAAGVSIHRLNESVLYDEIKTSEYARRHRFNRYLSTRNRRAAPVSHARRSIRSRGVALRYIDAM